MHKYVGKCSLFQAGMLAYLDGIDHTRRQWAEELKQYVHQCRVSSECHKNVLAYFDIKIEIANDDFESTIYHILQSERGKTAQIIDIVENKVYG